MKRTVTQLSLYSISALFAASSDWLVFALAIHLQSNHVVAQGIARIAGGVTSFLFNRHCSFHNGSRRITREIRRFIFLYVLSYCLSLSLFAILSGPIGVDIFVAKLATDGAIFFFNFTMMKHWVFEGTRNLDAQGSATAVCPQTRK